MAVPAKKQSGTKATPATTKAAPKGPSFELKKAVVQEDNTLPPNPARSRTVNREELIANMVAIQESPNEWYEIAHYAARAGSAEKPGGARKVVDAFLSGKVKAPEGAGEYDIEWRDAGYDGGGRKGSVVLAQFISNE
jgi:hypothetical protein